jgi:hypothetical protein
VTGRQDVRMTDPPHEFGEDTNLGLLPVLRHFEEQRCYPRVDLRTPVIVTTDAHEVAHAHIRNISTDGVQLRCDPQTASILHPRATHIVPGTGAMVMLRFHVPVSGRDRPFAARARLTYIAVKNPEEIAFGLRFDRVSQDNKRLLSEYISQCMLPCP